MLKLSPVIFLLAFALLIQNTCPHGFAGKTSLAPSCSNCPLKKCRITTSGQKNIASDSSSVHFPLYVFAVPKTTRTFQLEPIKAVRAIIADCYTDALPDELLRPPRA